MKKALTKPELEALGSWFDGHIEETEVAWEAARRQGGINTVGGLGCSSLAEASKIAGKGGGSASGRASIRSAVPLAAKSV